MLPLGNLSSLALRSGRNRIYSSLVTPKLPDHELTLPKTTLCRKTSTMPTPQGGSEEYVGEPGRNYRIERVLQEETFPPRWVGLARWVEIVYPIF